MNHDIERADSYCLKNIDHFYGGARYHLIEDNAVRVHDNYLCTYIGKLKNNFVEQ